MPSDSNFRNQKPLAGRLLPHDRKPTREPLPEVTTGLVWLLSPHPGRLRVTPIGHGGTIGREEGAAIRVDAPQVGPLHAKIELVPRATGRPEIFVTDLGHPSGTYVSGMRVQRTVLADGDILRVGSALALVVDRDPQS